MEHIIQQLALELAKTILEKSTSERIRDIGDLAESLLKDCKNTALEMLTVILEHLNDEIRQDKQGRKKEGLTLQQRQRSRTLLTSLGELTWERDYYRSKKEGTYRYLLDEVIGVRSYERIDDTLSAKMLNLAAEVSYEKAANITTGGAVSRQSVRNKLLKIAVPEKDLPEKAEIEELHVYADEDHVHMQRPEKQRGKKNQILPLVTVGEGVRHVSARRNATINPMHFVDENFDTKELWKSVAGYIGAAYEISKIKKIYLHGDGGRWIGNGLSDFAQVEHVMDTFHFSKRLRTLCKAFPERNVRVMIQNALRQNDRRHADKFLQELMDSAVDDRKRDEAKEFGTFLFNFWEENRKAIDTTISGSCTEGQVSHILSERFSRNPLGWSKAGLGKLAKVRVSVKNGRPIGGEDFKQREQNKNYATYADKVIEEHLKGARDWSLFEPEAPILNGASGTQVLIRSMSVNNGLLN